MDWIFRLHLFLTLYMTGLIWFVQVAHYPLMGRVGRAEFISYEQAHTRLASWVTAPPMLLEIATGGWLLWQYFPHSVFVVNFCLLLVIWASTFFIQVPLHNALSRSFAESSHRRLVNTNWIRTAAWTLRGVMLVAGWDFSGPI